MGHGFGFLTQNLRKSKAYSAGRTTRFACTKPGASPLVGPAYSSSRINPRTSPAVSSCSRKSCSIARKPSSSSFVRYAHSGRPCSRLTIIRYGVPASRLGDTGRYAFKSLLCRRKPLHHQGVVARHHVRRGVGEGAHEVEGAVHLSEVRDYAGRAVLLYVSVEV